MSDYVNINFFLFLIRLFSATIATTLENLGRTITTDFDGNPSLYITRARKNDQDHIYVNNAQIIRSRSNVQLENGKKRKQVKTRPNHGTMVYLRNGYFIKLMDNF